MGSDKVSSPTQRHIKPKAWGITSLLFLTTLTRNEAVISSPSSVRLRGVTSKGYHARRQHTRTLQVDSLGVGAPTTSKRSKGDRKKTNPGRGKSIYQEDFDYACQTVLSDDLEDGQLKDEHYASFLYNYCRAQDEDSRGPACEAPKGRKKNIFFSLPVIFKLLFVKTECPDMDAVGTLECLETLQMTKEDIVYEDEIDELCERSSLQLYSSGLLNMDNSAGDDAPEASPITTSPVSVSDASIFPSVAPSSHPAAPPSPGLSGDNSGSTGSDSRVHSTDSSTIFKPPSFGKDKGGLGGGQSKGSNTPESSTASSQSNSDTNTLALPLALVLGGLAFAMTLFATAVIITRRRPKCFDRCLAQNDPALVEDNSIPSEATNSLEYGKAETQSQGCTERLAIWISGSSNSVSNGDNCTDSVSKGDNSTDSGSETHSEHEKGRVDQEEKGDGVDIRGGKLDKNDKDSAGLGADLEVTGAIDTSLLLGAVVGSSRSGSSNHERKSVSSISEESVEELFDNTDSEDDKSDTNRDTEDNGKDESSDVTGGPSEESSEEEKVEDSSDENSRNKSTGDSEEETRIGNAEKQNIGVMVPDNIVNGVSTEDSAGDESNDEISIDVDKSPSARVRDMAAMFEEILPAAGCKSTQIRDGNDETDEQRVLGPEDSTERVSSPSLEGSDSDGQSSDSVSVTVAMVDASLASGQHQEPTDQHSEPDSQDLKSERGDISSAIESEKQCPSDMRSIAPSQQDSDRDSVSHYSA